jgi:hypothetical protein
MGCVHVGIDEVLGSTVVGDGGRGQLAEVDSRLGRTLALRRGLFWNLLTLTRFRWHLLVDPRKFHVVAEARVEASVQAEFRSARISVVPFDELPAQSGTGHFLVEVCSKDKQF